MTKTVSKVFSVILVSTLILSVASFARPQSALADGTYQSLPYSQDWSNTGLITVSDDWSGVSGVVGYRGDALTSATDVDPQTVLGQESPLVVDVNANQTNPNTFVTGGVTEFHITNPAVALTGSNTADAPYIVFLINATGFSSINVSYNIRDLDASTDNAPQQVALQYRVGETGNFTNIPAGYIADATTGPSLATLVTPINVTLPAAADNQSQLQIRVITTNAITSDEWVGIDDVSITGTPILNDPAPEVSDTFPDDGATDFPINANLTVTFSEPVNVTATWFDLSCSSSGNGISTTSSGGPTTFTLDPDVNLIEGENCTLTILASQVTDQDSNDPLDNMEFDFTVDFSPFDFCAAVYTPIYAIQGSGLSAAITGNVSTRGVVVGDYEGPSPTLRGFYLQDLDGDDDSATSDGIFVFNGNNNTVSLGDVVYVTGTASEFQDQTQISSSSIINCGSDSVDPVDVTFPVPSSTYLERYEGMLVTISQTMYVTEHFQLGRFGQIVLSSGGRLQQPTNVVAPGAAANALQTQNNLNKIILDDGTNLQNPDPIVFGRNGNPLSAANTLRGSDTATGIVGVMTYGFGGSSTFSPNAYRVRPINALNGYVNFVEANSRPTSAPAVGGSVKVVGMNLLNFFNTFADGNSGTPGCFPGGGDSDCRGANSATEFTRQYQKTVAAILAMDADVIGVNEIENDGYGPTSAIQFLVNQLNAAPTAPGTYAFIDVDAATGQVNAMGTDAIKVGLIYKPANVTPVGQTAVLNTVAFVNGGTSSPRSRPTIAQAFEVNATGARFIVDVNHLKSKGSCPALSTDVNADQGDGQSCWNLARVNAATELMSWLATDPTGISDADILLVGDYNSYAKENPIAVIEGAGFTNLIASFLGPDAYSYVFDGQWGYLDHALGSSSIVSQVSGVGDYHINSDEPSVLDYNTDFKSPGQITSLYAPDQFRVSDHDPVLVGLDLLHYDFTGFFQPVDNASVFNVAKGGSGIPVKFSLGGDQGLNIFLSGYPLSRQIACPSSSSTDNVEQTVNAGGSSLSYDPATDQYTYVWKTNKSWVGTCRQLVVILNDGSIHTANFQFK